MLYMVVEQYRNGDAEAVYRRLNEQGRLMPDGLAYVDSWVGADLERCFQLVETEDPALIETWIQKWDDLVEFEVTPVVSSERARALTQKG